MEEPISITSINDFIFCPVSIYFHSLDADSEKLTYQDSPQLNGAAAHRAVDEGSFSTKKTVLQGMTVYSEQYGLLGKIDYFDVESGELTEKKKKISRIYDGYIFQLFAQCFALREMGYEVKRLRLYSQTDNKVYPIALPEEQPEQKSAFEQILRQMQSFSFDTYEQTNAAKCAHCVYEPLCSFSIKENMYVDSSGL